MTQSSSFVEYLEGLRDDRGALAALRRGLGRAPGTVPDLYRYVVPWIPAKASRSCEHAHYLIAALYAYHPQSTATGNMGNHFAHARQPQGDDTALERRFSALLTAHPDDLPSFLRHAISFLKSQDTPINWQQLFLDVQRWDHPERFVQRQWARGFWGRCSQENTKKED